MDRIRLEKNRELFERLNEMGVIPTRMDSLNQAIRNVVENPSTGVRSKDRHVVEDAIPEITSQRSKYTEYPELFGYQEPWHIWVDEDKVIHTSSDSLQTTTAEAPVISTAGPPTNRSHFRGTDIWHTAPTALDDDLMHQKDFRATYSNILEQWLDLPDRPIVSGTFEETEFPLFRKTDPDDGAEDREPDEDLQAEEIRAATARVHSTLRSVTPRWVVERFDGNGAHHLFEDLVSIAQELQAEDGRFTWRFAFGVEIAKLAAGFVLERLRGEHARQKAQE